MARCLSQTLTRLARLSSSADPSAARVLSRRLRSSVPEESDKERVAMTKLEDAIHRIIVKRSEPDWLPFVPGSSYWVPPKSKARGVAQVIGKLLHSSSSTSMSKEEALTLTYSRGWPSSAYFFEASAICKFVKKAGIGCMYLGQRDIHYSSKKAAQLLRNRSCRQTILSKMTDFQQACAFQQKIVADWNITLYQSLFFLVYVE
ncbi:hypothetical protein Cgig2_031180 [Carnegiea gigantea]|uniref:Uncharacterized protein n=1 Tax=Carnegiea gigantea TaxID=171969 RepID=A0A9Q1QMB9_9CARY|nr:hypothetical protein Cgig2_031180 [Carnegiea gigantea]